MSDRTPCYRHPRETWIAGCPDCTTWHLTELHVPHTAPGTPRGADDAVTGPAERRSHTPA